MLRNLGSLRDSIENRAIPWVCPSNKNKMLFCLVITSFVTSWIPKIQLVTPFKFKYHFIFSIQIPCFWTWIVCCMFSFRLQSYVLLWHSSYMFHVSFHLFPIFLLCTLCFTISLSWTLQLPWTLILLFWISILRSFLHILLCHIQTLVYIFHPLVPLGARVHGDYIVIF